MESTQRILSHFQYISPQLMEIVFELRNIIASIQPEASETMHRRGLTYFDAARGGHVSAGICQINVYKDHIRLAFIHGAFLPDPHHLLVMEGERKAKRFIPLEKYENVPWEQLSDLIKASAAFDPYSVTSK